LDQECFSNGWTHHYLSSAFVFVPSGDIVAFILNNPGCIKKANLQSKGVCMQSWRKFLLPVVTNVLLTLHLLGVEMKFLLSHVKSYLPTQLISGYSLAQKQPL
jgi:hypothetical protein